MKEFILRRKTDDSEGDKYEYLIRRIGGVNIVTPYKRKAGRFVIEDDEEIEAVGEWECIEV